MAEVLPTNANATKFNFMEQKPSNQLPVEVVEDSNVRSYPAKLEQHAKDIEQLERDVNVGMLLPGIGIAQENLRDQRLSVKNAQLREERQKLDDITTFLDKVNQQKNNKEIDLTGENQLFDRLYAILPDPRLKNQKLKRDDAELLCRAFTRKSENHITPNIEDITTDMTHIIEDLDKILPILKDMLERYARLIERINSKAKG